MSTNRVFTNTQIWQYCHYCQLLFPYICSFLRNMCHVIVVNVKLYISMYRRVIFQGYRFFGILIISSGTAKQSWQYWHSCIVESLLKTIMGFFIIFVWIACSSFTVHRRDMQQITMLKCSCLKFTLCGSYQWYLWLLEVQLAQYALWPNGKAPVFLLRMIWFD